MSPQTVTPQTGEVWPTLKNKRPLRCYGAKRHTSRMATHIWRRVATYGKMTRFITRRVKKVGPRSFCKWLESLGWPAWPAWTTQNHRCIEGGATHKRTKATGRVASSPLRPCVFRWATRATPPNGGSPIHTIVFILLRFLSGFACRAMCASVAHFDVFKVGHTPKKWATVG